MQAESENGDQCPVYHPLFSSTDGDVVLGSKDRTLFRVHSYTLKTTSGWFRDMFSLPPTQDPESSSSYIYLDEDTPTLEGILRMVCGLPIPTLDSYEVIEPIMLAAEKYDMAGPMSIVRALVATPPFLSDPLRLYAVTCRYGWQEEARLASKHTLTLNVHAPEHRFTLMKLSPSSLLDLFDLHRSRREALRRRLDDPPFVNASGETRCSSCGNVVDYHTWRELKYAIILEMDVRPLGDTMCNEGLRDWPAARACWEAKCGNCDRALYDQQETLRVIRECVNQLPVTIDELDPALPIVAS